jgi:cellulose synthase/poly-beta-1,6-N-acetylglucosamine synthase-like glycosyltransferase
MLNFVEVLLLALEMGAALLVGYLLLLTGAAMRAPRNTPDIGTTASRFLVLIPAHNEERLLPGLLASLARLYYPAEYFRVHVIADNCSDQTAAIARAAGVMVHERRDPARPGKGPALDWVWQHLPANEPFDAVVILDADSVVSANFLAVMAARLARGERVVQAYYAVHHSRRSLAAGIRFAALAALHYLRPQGRMVLGGSAGLKGNGMMFAAALARRYHWAAELAEDIELHMRILLDGERVYFAPDAMVWAEMPDSLAASESQHHRWEVGRLRLARRYVPQLLRAALSALWSGQARRAFVLFDAVMEHLIPPFAILVGASAMLLLAGLLTGAERAAGLVAASAAVESLMVFNLLLSLGLLAGEAVYLLAALRLVQAPPSAYWQLLYAPVYIFWKVGQYLRAWLGQSEQAWVRTHRNDAA